MRTLFAFLCGITLAALTAQADDDTPTASEQQVIDALAPIKGKAFIDPLLSSESRVSVKFENATDAILTALAKHPQVGAIQAFEGTKCTDKGFKALQGLPHLRKLVLNKSGVTDVRLAAIVGCKELRELVIPESFVTDTGLAALKKLPRLETLDLSDNRKITDRGMASVKTLARIESLHLNNTSITDKGLNELKLLEGLRSLSVGGSKVTAKAAEKFPDMMPNLRVVRR